MPTYLKDKLKNGPIDFEFIARSAEITDVSKSTGRPYSYYNYTLKLRSTGDQCVERVMGGDHRACAGVQPGQLIRASLNDKGYPTFNPMPTGEAGLQVPTNNGQQVKSEKEYAEGCKAEWKFCKCDRCQKKQAEDEERWAKQEIAKTLGLTIKVTERTIAPLYMEYLKLTGAGQPKTLPEVMKAAKDIYEGALTLAKQMCPRFKLTVDEIYQEDQNEKKEKEEAAKAKELGLSPAPSHDPITKADAEKAFSPDDDVRG